MEKKSIKQAAGTLADALFDSKEQKAEREFWDRVGSDWLEKNDVDFSDSREQNFPVKVTRS